MFRRESFLIVDSSRDRFRIDERVIIKSFWLIILREWGDDFRGTPAMLNIST